jgi:hypothetical protein
MRILSLTVALTAAAALAACTPSAPVHDKAYFVAHADERKSTLAECRNNPGELEKTPNCVNATSADGQAESDRFWAVKKPASRVANPGSL